jgi:hypothetical protein
MIRKPEYQPAERFVRSAHEDRGELRRNWLWMKYGIPASADVGIFRFNRGKM